MFMVLGWMLAACVAPAERTASIEETTGALSAWRGYTCACTGDDERIDLTCFERNTVVLTESEHFELPWPDQRNLRQVVPSRWQHHLAAPVFLTPPITGAAELSVGTTAPSPLAEDDADYFPLYVHRLTHEATRACHDPDPEATQLCYELPAGTLTGGVFWCDDQRETP